LISSAAFALARKLGHEISDLLAHLDGCRVIASISGGKDSEAMSLYFRELGIEHDRVFMDTGWEHAATYRHLDVLERVLGPITRLRPAFRPEQIQQLLDTVQRPRVRAAVEARNAMVILCLTKTMFPSRVSRFCTEELKVFPFLRHIEQFIDAGQDVINAVGVRAAESEKRSKFPEWEELRWWSKRRNLAGCDPRHEYDCEVWRPLLRATFQDVIDIHQRHGLRPNSLYFRGAIRVGCWPCIFARKSEIRFLADDDPERIALIEELEAELTDRARERAREKGEELIWERTWFQQGSGRKLVELWPIRKTVAWSRTLRGGRVEDRQVELFARADEGCMRWGMCETSAPDGDK
jgi:3'-phosphoadenosine 5'-phosphosulfate sulfotransferase (PAPS reductase)/FAD synthetase